MSFNRYYSLFSLHSSNQWRGGETTVYYNNFVSSLVQKGFSHLGSGGTRLAYARGNFIIKVPRYADGIIDNMVEHWIWHKYRSNPTSRNIKVAPSRLISNGCLLMVKVDPNINWDEIGDDSWVRKNMIDGFQGGYYKDKLVVYDYALEARERDELEASWGIKSHVLHSKDWNDFFREKVLKGATVPFEEIERK